MTPPAPAAREAAALSSTERHLLFHEWCDTARDYPLVPLIHELVAERARLGPAAIAVADGDRRGARAALPAAPARAVAARDLAARGPRADRQPLADAFAAVAMPGVVMPGRPARRAVIRSALDARPR